VSSYYSDLKGSALATCQLQNFKLLLLVFKTLNGLGFFSRPLRSSVRDLLIIPKVRIKTYGETSFSYDGPHPWMSLPENLRAAKNLCFLNQAQDLELLFIHLFNCCYRWWYYYSFFPIHLGVNPLFFFFLFFLNVI